MALKINGNETKISTPKVDYTSHFEAKPVVESVTIEKKKEGEGYGPVGETVQQYPGAFSTRANNCTVTIEGGRTLNLGNYESARIGVSIAIPCDSEKLNEAYEWGTNWVSEKIEATIAGVK